MNGGGFDLAPAAANAPLHAHEQSWDSTLSLRERVQNEINCNTCVCFWMQNRQVKARSACLPLPGHLCSPHRTERLNSASALGNIPRIRQWNHICDSIIGNCLRIEVVILVFSRKFISLAVLGSPAFVSKPKKAKCLFCKCSIMQNIRVLHAE